MKYSWFLGILLGFSVAAAGTANWTSNGPYGAPMNQILIDTNNPSTLFATGSQFDTRPSLYRSTNAGTTWIRLGPRIPLVLLEDPSSSLLYGFSTQSFYRSTDLGRTWIQSATGLNDHGIQVATVDPGNPAFLYGAYSKGLYISSDKGKTWKHSGKGLTGYIWDVAVSSVRKGQVYAATEDGFFRSSDGGRSWIKRNAGLPGEARYSDIGVAPDGRLFLASHERGSDSFVYQSSNNGDTWVRLNFDFNRPSEFLFDRSGGTLFYVTSEFGSVWKTSDGGQTFSNVSPGEENCAIPSAVLDPRSSSLLYISACGIRKSTDGGQHYTLLKTEGLLTTSIYVPPAQANAVYAGTYSGLFQSASGGAQWKQAAALPERVSCVEGTVDSPSVLYACVFAESAPGIYKSTDAGSNWSLVHSMPDAWPERISISRANSNVLYAITFRKEVLRSTDAGSTWTMKFPGVYAEAIAADSASSETVYVLGRQQLRKSSDGGNSWSTTGTGLVPYRSPIAIEVHPIRPNEIYAALETGIFRSTNSGAAWSRISQDIPDCIKAFFMDPVNPELLYAATIYNGLFRSNDGGLTWHRMRLTGILTANDQYSAIRSISADSLRHTVYVGTSSGVYAVGPSSASPPYVWGVTPALYRSEKTFTIHGQKFGSTPGKVLINQQPAGRILQWSETRIVIEPSGAETGELTVVANGRRSNPMEFLVLPQNGISPEHGPARGGTLVTIDPERQIYPDLTVLFGDTIAPVAVMGSKRTTCGYNRIPILIVRTPPHARGPATVVFKDIGGLPPGTAGTFRFE